MTSNSARTTSKARADPEIHHVERDGVVAEVDDDERAGAGDEAEHGHRGATPEVEPFFEQRDRRLQHRSDAPAPR